MVLCNRCGKESSVFVYSKVLDEIVCKKCGIELKDVVVGRRGIYDATGKPRDRIWLNNKLDYTSSDKKWHADIKSRRILPNGQVVRVKR